MSASKVIKLIKEKEVEYVDLRITDPRVKLQHLTMDGKMVDEKMLNEGVFLTVHRLLDGNQFTNLTCC